MRLAKENNFSYIEIRSDSKYLLNCLTQYLPLWQSNGWTRTNRKVVENREILQELLDEVKGITVRWAYVPAHVTNIGNNYADFLARWATFKHRNP